MLRIDKVNAALKNHVMDTIDETRLKRLKLLISINGTQANLARAIKKSPAQISQWVNRSEDAKTGKPRVMDSDSARDIEVELNLERGWMDQPVDDGPSNWPFPMIPRETIDALTPEGKGYLQGVIKGALKELDMPTAQNHNVPHSGNAKHAA